MKYLLTIFFLSFFLNNLYAQEKHFVFIQSDAKQPFYASVKGKLYSSTASGYLIIPKLTDGSYNLTVGFAQNTYPEQTFTVAIQNKDLGFDLKNFNEKGWGLFNLQSLDITMASTGNSNVVAKALNASSKALPDVISFDKKKDADGVSVKAVTDTSVNNTAKVEEVKGAVAKAPALAATANSGMPAIDNPPATGQQSKAVANTAQTGDVKKVSEVTGDEGVHLSYVEGSGKAKDTINIVIPSTPASANSTSSPTTTSGSANKNNTGSSNQGNPVPPVATGQDNLKFLDLKNGAKKDSTGAVLTTTENRRILENSNCKNVATDDDYVKLRKKMAGETTDDKMISEARKFYHNKCFTTSQIKALSTLFLSDEGRLKFFDASFVSVVDASQYSTLQTEFIDPAFVNRFKSLIQ